MNRLDKVVVFRPLRREQLEEVLNIELAMVQKRMWETAMASFPLRVTEQGRGFLLQQGTDQRYGARHLKRAIERYVVRPLASLISTGQLKSAESVSINWDGSSSHLDFYRQPQPRPIQTAAHWHAGGAEVAGFGLTRVA
jgi:ATP-dependent Clp protease ATP-binding subunit ClpA